MKRFSLSFLAGMFLVAATFSAALAGPRVGVAKGDADLAKESAADYTYRMEAVQPYDYDAAVIPVIFNEAKWGKESEAAIEKLVREAIKSSGNFPVKPGNTVFIKPNLVVSAPYLLAMNKAKSEDFLATDTDPRVVRAIALVALEAGASKVRMGDTPAEGSSYAVAAALGYKHVVEELNQKYPGKVELMDMQALPFKFYKPPTTGGLAIKEYAIPSILVDSDVLISVPKMKTHTMAGVTLAMKCIGIGAPTSTVYGQMKLGLPHGRLAEEIVDVCDICGIEYAVIDGIWAMEGAGPLGGVNVEMNVIVAGADPVAVDWVGAELMGFKGDSIGTVRLGQKMKLGTFKDVDVAGTSIAQAVKMFENVPTASRSPGVYVHNVGWGPEAPAKDQK